MESQVFKDRLAYLLYKYSVNKSELARKLGIAFSTVHRWFNEDLMRNDIRVTTKYYVHTDAQTLLDEVNNALR